MTWTHAVRAQVLTRLLEQRLANLHAEVARLAPVHAQADHAVLESPAQQLVVVSIPPAWRGGRVAAPATGTGQ